eukprot:11211248-Lingulodinium_polyedra.AAC.1
MFARQALRADFQPARSRAHHEEQHGQQLFQREENAARARLGAQDAEARGRFHAERFASEAEVQRAQQRLEVLWRQ